MEQPVKFIWTHDAFRVGEDGPTHEPVEQEAQVRLLEKLKNHKGHNSMLVLRPADVVETTVAWKLAMENVYTPTALILSRQNITDLPAKENRYQEALQAEKGAYIVNEDANADVILFGFRFRGIDLGRGRRPASCRWHKGSYRFRTFRRSIPFTKQRVPRIHSSRRKQDFRLNRWSSG